jgi:hypothetical protein
LTVFDRNMPTPTRRQLTVKLVVLMVLMSLMRVAVMTRVPVSMRVMSRVMTHH